MCGRAAAGVRAAAEGEAERRRRLSAPARRAYSDSMRARELADIPTITLCPGLEMPVIGLGLYRCAPGEETQRAVTTALSVGYRRFDTAAMYGNEQDVGAAVRASGIERADVFVATKLQNSDHGYDAALRALEQSLARLGFEHVDLYLIHWPVPGLRAETWRALLRLRAEGRCRAVGVCNYTERHLFELLETGEGAPALNQVELSPFLHQRGLLALCAAAGIQVEAYSPLTRARKLADPTVARVAVAHDRTPAQVLLRWSIQRGATVIPKSVTPEHLALNLRVFDFELTSDDMAALDGLDEGLRTCWDPSRVP